MSLSTEATRCQSASGSRQREFVLVVDLLMGSLCAIRCEEYARDPARYQRL